MDKKEILNQLNQTGEVSIFRRSNNWDKAFELYNKTTGQHKHQNCGTCYREVLKWLQN